MIPTRSVQGLPDMREALTSIPTKLRRRVLLAALKKGARPVQDEARREAPVLKLAFQTPYRKSGTVRKAISVRASKLARRAGDVGVFVNVRPAAGAKFKTIRTSFGHAIRVKTKASKRGALSPDDPFYWRFVNFDHRSRAGNLIPGAHFLESGARRLPDSLNIITRELAVAFAKLERNGKDPL